MVFFFPAVCASTGVAMRRSTADNTEVQAVADFVSEGMGSLRLVKGNCSKRLV